MTFVWFTGRMTSPQKRRIVGVVRSLLRLFITREGATVRALLLGW
ncbi:hypothetical protein KKH3_43340 [Pectobacterium actinidiae]|nr:hypothetical protein KKH3_43340 [Pectobacterium actinidiae]